MPAVRHDERAGASAVSPAASCSIAQAIAANTAAAVSSSGAGLSITCIARIIRHLSVFRFVLCERKRKYIGLTQATDFDPFTGHFSPRWAKNDHNDHVEKYRCEQSCPGAA